MAGIEWFPASGVDADLENIEADLENIEAIFGEIGQKILKNAVIGVVGVVGVLALPVVLVGGTIVGAVRFFRKYRSRSR